MSGAVQEAIESMRIVVFGSGGLERGEKRMDGILDSGKS